MIRQPGLVSLLLSSLLLMHEREMRERRMPYALVLHCVPAEGKLNRQDVQGQKALALFLQELIEKQDASLAARLHAPRNYKPFTTTILPRKETQTPEAVCLRLTILDDTLYPVLSRFFLQRLGNVPRLRLGQTELLVSHVLVTPESDEPWAGFASFDALLANASEDETSWGITFATPTTFRTGNAEIPLPIPRLCFQSWLNSWDEHAPQPFFSDKDTRRAFLFEVVEPHVSVSYDQLRLVRQHLYFDGVRTGEQGFMGTCRFWLKSSQVAPPYRKILSALASYSFYAGTGRKTTMGMGMSRRLEERGRGNGRSTTVLRGR